LFAHEVGDESLELILATRGRREGQIPAALCKELGEPLRRLEEPVPEAEDEEPEFEDDDHQEVDEGHAAITEGSTDDDDAGDHVSGDQVEEPPAAGQGPGRNRGRSRRGKGNDGDDQTGTDGPPII